ncbi:MAG TPA: alpha/beta fold hydrolase [Mycobacteriales bacterium]|jgi:ABC-2 type transport system ATP-binding protein
MRRLALLAVATAALGYAPAARAEVTVTKTTVHVDTTVGPDGTTHCDVVGDLYVPSTATAATPAPAILTTNGFGGSKDDQAGTGEAFGRRGYVVLSYSGLGFGGSGCNIQLDDRDWDGKAAQDLVTYLAGLDYVRKDAPGDPRVGMIGGSYGGQVQYAAAAVDDRIDTLVPLITWHDLAYSLTPNNVAFGAQPDGVTPGVPKQQWTELFFALGSSQPAQHPDATPNPPSTCPGFDPRVCPANATSAALGYPTRDTIDFLRHASVGTFLDDIDVPVLIAQGEADTLFNLNEAVATYQGLKARGVPVKLMFQSWGHSNLGPAPGELDLANPEETYQGQVFAAWFDRWLKDLPVDTGPEFEYFRPWVTYSGSAAPAYGSAPRYPLKDSVTLRLSGTGALVGPGSVVTAGTATFVSPPGGQPASYSETAFAQDQEPAKSIPPTDPPGTFAAFTTEPLEDDVDVVGVPVLDVALTIPATTSDPATQAVLFAKLYDVAPDGTQHLPHRLVAAARIAPAAGKARIHLPGIVERFEAGHRLRLVLATTDQSYLNQRLPKAVTVTNDPASPNTLSFPVAARSDAAFPRVLGTRVPPAAPAPPRTIPSTGLADAVPLVALGTVAAAAIAARAARRRRRDAWADPVL